MPPLKPTSAPVALTPWTCGPTSCTSWMMPIGSDGVLPTDLICWPPTAPNMPVPFWVWVCEIVRSVIVWPRPSNTPENVLV